MKNINTRKIALSAAFASVSAFVQLFHIGYQSPQWGMWIDVVAVTWFVAFFILGIRASLLVSIVSGIIITLFAPDTILGASMKLLATLPLLFMLSLTIVIFKKKISYFSNWKTLVLPVLIGIVLRIMIIIPVNYFYAIPIWTKMTPAQAMSAIPWYIIALFNIIQSLLEISIAWILSYRFQLVKYSQD
jgi:riboflavin transporter